MMEVLLVALIVGGLISIVWIRIRAAKKAREIGAGAPVCTAMVLYSPPLSKGDLIRKYLRFPKAMVRWRPPSNASEPEVTKDEHKSSGLKKDVKKDEEAEKSHLVLILLGLIVTAIVAFVASVLIWWAISSQLSAPTKVVVSESASEVLPTESTGSSWIASIVIFVLIVSVFSIVAYYRHRKKKNGVTVTKTSPAATDQKNEHWFWTLVWWLPRQLYRLEWKKHGRLASYPLIVLGLFAVAGGYLWKYHYTGWWEPWGKDPLLFFLLFPIALMIIAGIATLNRKIPYIVASILFVIVMVPVLKAYENSGWWMDKMAARDARLEAERIAAAGPGGEVRIAESDSWSEPVAVNGNRFSCEPQWDTDDRRIWVRADNGPAVEYRKGSSKLRLGQRIQTLEFRAEDGRPPVKVIVTIK